MSELKRIGIVGCGVVGGQLAQSISNYFSDRARLMVLCDQNHEKAQVLSNLLRPHPDVLPLESIPLHCDLVIEAASPNVCRELVPKAVEMGRDVVVMSVEGLIEIYEEVFAKAREKRSNIYIPSGSVVGIDGLESAMTGGVSSVCLTAYRPVVALADEPWLIRKSWNPEGIIEETIIFEGSAREAISAFPSHVNAAAIVSFAGLGLDQTRVRIFTGPRVTANIYELEVIGNFGRMTSRTENLPSPQNPKTSHLAVLSACAILNEIMNPVKIGT